MPLLGDPAHSEMVAELERLAATFDRPAALVIVSAHWEEPVPTITSAANPRLLYDYYNFPEEAYRITYPCPGEPVLAQRIAEAFTKSGIESRFEQERGLDHGVFVPLKIMYPEADIPCVELSLMESLDPAQHIATGRALASLHEQGVLVIGSGFSFHNFRAAQMDAAESQQSNEAFEHWLQEVCSSASMTEAERSAALVRWSEAPGARHCHPREEHLMPLHVCYGVAETAATESIALRIMNKSASMFLW